MSTILDALKKSEQERKLGDIPTLSDMPTPDEGAQVSSAWIIALLVVLLVMLTALILIFTVFDDATPTAVVATDARIVNNDTVATEQSSKESIVVNVVSWSEQAEQRFAIIDGKLVREGEFVRPGLKVERIQQDSVVLNHRGQRLERRP